MKLIAGMLVSACAAFCCPAWGAAAASRDWGVLQTYCVDCHNAVDWAGGLSLDGVEPDSVVAEAATWETAIRKMRTGMMPPPGEPRPARARVESLAGFLETRLDAAAEQQPNPGSKSLHRLNRTEYANAIRDLLALELDVATLLPADDAAEGFDNMADVLSVSPTLIQAYVSAAMKISRIAVGDPATASVLAKYTPPGGLAGRSHVEGMPLGTVGGLRFSHYFPLDAEYEFRVSAGGGLRFGGGADSGPTSRIDVTMNGAAVQVPDPRRFRIRVPAGPQTITVAMVEQQRAQGVDELFARTPPRFESVSEVSIQGPIDPTGPGDTPSRRAIFVCQPTAASDEAPCARRILAQLASAAFRRNTAPDDAIVDRLMGFHAEGSRSGGFEAGIQQALARILVDLRFLYRIEADRTELPDGAIYRISDHELASRLSFFLWSSIPDARLRQVADAGQLHDPKVLEREVRRMLADSRARALTDNFAGQWLRLRELENAEPLDRGFDDELRRAFLQETQMLFASVLSENRSVVDLLDADYTFLNERLARHYGIDGVRGGFMRRVQLPVDSERRGLLGQGSILTVTSAGNRTSPVARGAWVLESLLGAPVPQPPPGVEADLKESPDAVRPLSVRERMEAHRANPTCASCHQAMDPIGFAMENFDLIGRWRDKENGVPVNARDRLGDGTEVNGVGDVRRVLQSHAGEYVTNVSEKLLQYALGRRLEHYDMPAVRRIVEEARADRHSLVALVLGVVNSVPFQQRQRAYGEAAPPPDSRQAARPALQPESGRP